MRRQIKKEYIDTGKVKLVFRDFPLENIHPMALSAAIAAECVREQGGDNAYYSYHDRLFKNQISIDIKNLKTWANEIGYNIDSCLDNQKYLQEVNKDAADGKAAGVQGIPYFIIEGQVLSGAQPFEVFKQIIDEKCKDKGCVEIGQMCQPLIADPMIVNEIDEYRFAGKQDDYQDNMIITQLEYESDDGKEINVYIGRLNDIHAEMRYSRFFRDILDKGFWTIYYYWDETNNVKRQYYIIGEEEEKLALWTNKNMFIAIGYDNKVPQNDMDFVKIIEKLKDNTFESSGGLIENPTVLTLIGLYMESCTSTVEESCYPSWERKIEPIVCPPHEYQTEIVKDTNACSFKKIENKIECSPGICSGCYIPRWSGARDNICIPYGTRLLFEEGDEFTAYESEIDQELFSTIINEDQSATIEVIKDFSYLSDRNFELIVNGETFYGKIGESYTIFEGKDYDITILENGMKGNYKVTVDEIHYSERVDERFIKLTLHNDYPAYCNYDGEMKQQKTIDYQGNWASCQNNYECESNICSSGECIEVAQALQKVKGLRVLLIRIICRLGSLFNNEEYDQCIAEYLN